MSREAQSPPSVVVIGGPNGAGKTTAARTILAETLALFTFVNADVIAQGLSGFAPETTAVEAGRIMLARLRSLAEEREDFAFETTLAGRFFAGWLQELRESGYEVHLVYFWLESAEVAVSRVAARVRMGGHNVPEATIRQRYRRSITNFFRLYRPLVSSWRAYDTTTEGMYRIVAHGESAQETVLEEGIWQRMQETA